MIDNSDARGFDSPEDIAQAEMQSYSEQEHAQPSDDDTAVDGKVVVDRVRHAGRHRIIIIGRTEVDHQVGE